MAIVSLLCVPFHSLIIVLQSLRKQTYQTPAVVFSLDEARAKMTKTYCINVELSEHTVNIYNGSAVFSNT